jgi:2-polyprenyl-3-methyl-5-hydroxy-6-metoxy-1,4-benzoquinol methylase
MKPDDLVEFSRETYAHPNQVEEFSKEEMVASGLSPDENTLLHQLPLKEGRMLLLGVGGGREAIPLARAGFEITGVDFIPTLVERAIENAEKKGLKISGLVQEISNLQVPDHSYDVVWLSFRLYSSIPTRKRRIEMLRRIQKTLRPDGYFICQFLWDTGTGPSRKVRLCRKIIAYLCLGNLQCEAGDRLWNHTEFMHAFKTEKEIGKEFAAVGFEVVHLHISEEMLSGGAVLRGGNV